MFGDPTQFFGLKGLIGGNAAPAVEAIAAAPGVEAVEAVEETLIPLVFTMPASVFVAFQLMFAIITVALISGAVADRIKFGAWLLFAGLWVTFVYFPVAHWVFSFDGGTAETGGWIANKLAAIDFAGGTAVHINAGTAALVLVLILGKRKGLADYTDAAAQSAVRDAGRRPAVVRLVRLQRRLGRRLRRPCRFDVRHHHGRHRGGDAGVVAHGAHSRREGDIAGRSLGCGCRSGCHHAVVFLGQRRRCTCHRCGRRVAVRIGCRPEIQTGL